MSQIKPDRSYKPPSENPRHLDTFPFGQQEQLLVGNENSIIIKARLKLFEKFSAEELILNRKVCREWRDQINQLLEQRVINVFLFSSRYDLLQWLYFLKQARLTDDHNYSLDKTFQSFPNFVLFVNDITNFANNDLLRHFTSTKRLIYYGEPEFDKYGFVTNQPWHQKLTRVVECLRNLSSLVLHHWGYFLGYFPIEQCEIAFSSLTSIHLVQPGMFAYTQLVKSPGRSILSIGYDFSNRNSAAVSTIKENAKEDGKTFFYVHLMHSWSDAHNEIYLGRNIVPEVYLPTDISFD